VLQFPGSVPGFPGILPVSAAPPPPAGGYGPRRSPTHRERKRDDDGDEPPYHFTEADDERLIRIMAERCWPLKVGEWGEIQQEMEGFTARQLRDRWVNYLKPPLDRSAFTIEERRAALKESVNAFGNWKRVAAHLGDGRRRSPAMVKNLVTHLMARLRRLGFPISSEGDVDLLPDAIFERGVRPGEELDQILGEYKAKKSVAVLPDSIFPLTIASLLN
jgi:hypothetical protein